ncbi:MAG: polysaccharide deacetylase family protein [Lysobacterales bacterium]
MDNVSATSTPAEWPARGSKVRPRQGAWMRAAAAALSPAGARARLTILIFHRVRATPDSLFPGAMDARMFRERMEWARSWFRILPLREAVAALKRGVLPPRAMSVTFDDGYADNQEIALPILRDLDLHATFFVASAFIDGGCMWNDGVIEALRRSRHPRLDLSPLGLGVHALDSDAARRSVIEALLTALKYRSPRERLESVEALATIAGVAVPNDLMMTTSAVRDLAAAGMDIGAHTMTHPILARIASAEARNEIAGGREALAGMVGRSIDLFAYPNGRPGIDYTHEHVAMVRALGFGAAVSTRRGAARSSETSLFELPRFTPWDRTPGRWGIRLLQHLVVPAEKGAA